MPTFLGDVMKEYTKNAGHGAGQLVIRKPHSNQKSARLKARQDAVAKAGRSGNLSKAVHDRLVKEGKCPTQKVYEDGKGYKEMPVCPMEDMVAGLREAMSNVK